MKVAISSNGSNIDSTIHERFGRCPYFLIVEIDDMSCEVIENGNADLPTSAGIQSASLVASKGVEAVITGNCGPKAMQVFAETNIRVITGQHGKIGDAVEQFKTSPTGHAAQKYMPEDFSVRPNAAFTGNRQPGMGGGGGLGMGGGGGRGMGGGGGRGMGGGGGRGMGGCGGRGMGRRCNSPQGMGSSGVTPVAGNLTQAQERADLQQQADILKQQMQAIQSKIKDLA